MSFYDTALHYLLLYAMLFLSTTIFFCLIRAMRGPRLTDRLVGVNMIVAKTVMLLVIVSLYIGEGYLMDLALVYSFLSFFAVVVLTQYVAQFKKNRFQKNKFDKSEKAVNSKDANN